MLVVLSLVLVFVIAALYGRLSVQIVPEPERIILPPMAPHPRNLKAKEARRRFRADRLYRLVSARTVILFPSTTVDWGVSTFLATFFLAALINEHGRDLVQYMLDTLLPGEGPALADMSAAMVLTAIFTMVLVITLGVARQHQQKKAVRIAKDLAIRGEQPRFEQSRNFGYYLELRRWEKGHGRRRNRRWQEQGR